MPGGLIAERMLEPFPPLRGVKERIMPLTDFQSIGGPIPADNSDSNAGTTRTVNGVVNPTLKIRPGETQFWRIADIGADIYYRLKLDGHVLYEIPGDGNRHNRVVAQDEILFPHNRKFPTAPTKPPRSGLLCCADDTGHRGFGHTAQRPLPRMMLQAIDTPSTVAGPNPIA